MDKATGHTTLIVGRKPVLEVLETDPARIEKVLLQQGGERTGLHAIRRAAAEAGVPFQFVPSNRLDREAPGLHHQGVVAVASPLAYQELEAMLEGIAPDLEAVQQRKPLLLALDQVEDPHNFGAVIRTAVAAGADGIIVPRHHMAPLSAVAIKASAGTATRIPIARTGNLADTLYQLKERGYWIAGAAGNGDTSVWTMDWDRPLALVLGSEGKGLRPRVAQMCDYLVAIPMRGPVESLNVSVAAGVLLFAATRGRAPRTQG